MDHFSIEAMKLGAQGVSILSATGDDGVAGYKARNDTKMVRFSLIDYFLFLHHQIPSNIYYDYHCTLKSYQSYMYYYFPPCWHGLFYFLFVYNLFSVNIQHHFQQLVHGLLP